MAKGTVYDSERAILRDPRSGLRVFRLTHGPTISSNLYIEMCSFTEDDSHVILLSQRYANRDAPWDLFRAKTDGTELVQLTDIDDLGGVVVCPGVGAVLYQSAGELRKLDIVSLEEGPVAEIPGGPGRSMGTVDARGTTYFGTSSTDNGKQALFRADLATGNVELLQEGDGYGHLHVDPTGTTLYFNEYVAGKDPEKDCGRYLIDSDGDNLRPYPFRRFAHHTWLGTTGKMQGPLIPPGHAIVTFKEGDHEPAILTEGRYYWHSSASRDAQWIVSDTNWPQEGLYLLHVPSRTVTYVCDPRSTPSHPQWTHPHPSFSPGLRYVVFNSDVTGIGQIYLVELTDEFLEQAAQGYTCRPNAGP